MWGVFAQRRREIGFCTEATMPPEGQVLLAFSRLFAFYLCKTVENFPIKDFSALAQ